MDRRGALLTAPRVCALAVTPVKGTALHFPETVELAANGVEVNRSFYLVDGRGRMVNGKRHGTLVALRADYEPGLDRLRLRFPDGTEVAAPVSRTEERVQTDFYGRPVAGRVLNGPWASALSAYLDEPVRLVAAERSGDAVDVHPVTIVSRASIEALRDGAGEPAIERRRFRMLVEVDGCDAYAEDAWVGRTITLGGSRVRIEGPVPRCVVTTHDPDTGIRDLPTLKLLLEQRGARVGAALDTPVDHLPDGGKLCFGVYGTVERPGEVRLGDAVAAW